jgi:hypothetical protein
VRCVHSKEKVGRKLTSWRKYNSRLQQTESALSSGLLFVMFFFAEFDQLNSEVRTGKVELSPCLDHGQGISGRFET